MWIKIHQIALDCTACPTTPEAALPELLRQKLGFAPLQFRVLSRGVDARRGHPKFLYSVAAEVDQNPTGEAEVDPAELEMRWNPRWQMPRKIRKLDAPLVVGTGPCGIFAAMLLAEAGCRPVIVDRGFPVEIRAKDYHDFLQTRQLNPESNLLIGEGGAGTWSDGKLYTGTSSAAAFKILQTYVDCGAPPEILWHKRPHIGSDLLPDVAAEMRKRLENAGATFRFGCEVTGIVIRNNRCTGVTLASGEVLEAPAVILAAGLGGRALHESLRNAKILHALKGFQLGCRVEHPQSYVDRAQYRINSRPAVLGAAEYHLASRPGKVRQVSSFCMCPGGEVVAAGAWEGQSVSNGMSRVARDGAFANAALIATIPPEESGSAQEAFAMLRDLEKKAFAMGGGDYTFPAQDAAGFLRGEVSLRHRKSSAAVGLHPARLDELLPAAIRDALRNAFRDFDRRYPGFIKEGKLIGLESCVSSPVRFLRDPENLASSLPGLWIGGEFGGFAGGILSAAADGVRIAECILDEEKKF